MKLTLEKAKAMMGQNNNGNLDLIGTKITELPDNLTVGGWLNLRGTKITALPDNLTVGGGLDLSNSRFCWWNYFLRTIYILPQKTLPYKVFLNQKISYYIEIRKNVKNITHFKK